MRPGRPGVPNTEAGMTEGVRQDLFGPFSRPGGRGRHLGAVAGNGADI